MPVIQEVQKVVQERKNSTQGQQPQENVAESVKVAEKSPEQRQSLSVPPEQRLYEQMKKLVDFANLHNPEKTLSGELLRTFVQEQDSCPSADEVLKKSQQLVTTTKAAEQEQTKISPQITLAARQRRSAGH